MYFYYFSMYTIFQLQKRSKWDDNPFSHFPLFISLKKIKYRRVHTFLYALHIRCLLFWLRSPHSLITFVHACMKAARLETFFGGEEVCTFSYSFSLVFPTRFFFSFFFFLCSHIWPSSVTHYPNMFAFTTWKMWIKGRGVVSSGYKIRGYPSASNSIIIV